jgi:serine/threonine protein kinase
VWPVTMQCTDVTEAAVRVGRTLRDKWHLDALIDVGGMAAVYAATHRNGMRGAVKILHVHRSHDPDIAARFRREGYIANKVAHPNAVRVLDDDVDDDGSVFLVMELLEGATLWERAGGLGGRLPAKEVLLAVDQLLDVLAVAHDVAIVHRDVKPDNVFVTADGRVKILDFGIARLYEPGAIQHSDTLAGLPMGSPAFMSPEQARGRWDLVGPQSDVWSVGATMFTLLSGRDVHTEETVPELLAAIFTEPAPSLATALPDAHPAIVGIVDRALQRRLADRWPDARTMQSAVRSTYMAMYGTAIPVRALAEHDPRSSVHDEGPPASLEPAIVATTVLGAKARIRRYPRRIATAAAFLVAAALGTASVDRDGRTQERRPSGTPLGELVETSTALSTTPARPLPVIVAPLDILPMHAAPVRPGRAVSPFHRGRYGSVYDRRY